MNDSEVVRSATQAIQELQKQRAAKEEGLKCYSALHSRAKVTSSQIVLNGMMKQLAEDLGDIDRKIMVLTESLKELPKLCSSCKGKGNDEGLQDPCGQCLGTGLHLVLSPETAPAMGRALMEKHHSNLQ